MSKFCHAHLRDWLEPSYIIVPDWDSTFQFNSATCWLPYLELSQMVQSRWIDT